LTEFECKLDSGSWAACTSPKAYSSPAIGSHTFSVRATDAADNTDASPATQTWTIDPPGDNTPPGAAITSGPSGSTSSTTASFAFGSSDPSSVFECSLDSGSWESCTSPKEYSGLSAGSHTFSVRATDAAGNTDPSPASESWTIDPLADNTPPGTSISSGPARYTSSTSATFAFSSRDPDPVFECRLDSGSWEPCTSPETYSGLSAGWHSFSVRSTDAAGNTDATPAVQGWRITRHPLVVGRDNVIGDRERRN
jgi:hypothetical protein